MKARLAGEQLEAGNVEDAAVQLTAARDLDPENTSLVPLQARILLAQGDVAGAERVLAGANLSGPAAAEAAYLLGVVCQQRAQWEKAFEHYARAAELAPDEVANQAAVAQVLLQLGRASDAREWLLSSRERFGQTAAWLAAFAEAAEQVGEWSEAASAWRQIVQDPASDPGLQERLALALFRAENYAEVRPLLEAILARSDPANERHTAASAWRLALMDTCLELRDLDAARDQVTEMLRGDRRCLPAWHRLIRVLAADGELDRAARAADQALKLDPRDPTALELAAAVSWRAGNRQRASEYARKLMEVSSAPNPVAERILASDAPTENP